MDAILYYLVFTEDTNGTIIYINKSTMNELNNREQEQYAEPTTKKSSKQIVKRTLVGDRVGFGGICSILRDLSVYLTRS